MADFRVVAIISAFNEADVISPVIGHLVENGVDVYLIDNHSTDGTSEQARPWLRKGLLGIEKFPAERPAGEGPPPFDWEAILQRKEELAKELTADWFIHHDADEFREPPWPGMKLRDAIRWVDRLGYNCIDFRVLNFPPVENGFQPGADPSRHFTHWEDPVVYDTLQRKCWKAQKTGVSLAASGGHEARFPERRVFPIRFLLRHYPIRSQEHGRRKVFDDRKKRFVEKERAKGWHVQYDSIADESHSFLGDPTKLHAYDPDRVRLELMLQSEPLRAAEGKARELTSALETARLELAGAQASRHEAEKHAATLEKDRTKLTEHLIERERHIANLETTRGHLERHAAGLEKDRDGLAARLLDRERHAANLESALGNAQQHASGLERDRATLAKHIEHLEEVRDRLESIRVDREKHAANLETTVAQLEQYAAEKERQLASLAEVRAERERHIGHLEAARAELELHASNLEHERQTLTGEASKRADRIRHLTGELEAVRSSRSWRWTAPLRRLFEALKR